MSNPIKYQNFSLSSNSKLLSFLPAQVCWWVFLYCQMPPSRTDVQNIRDSHTAFPATCKTFSGWSLARRLTPAPGESLGSLHSSKHPSCVSSSRDNVLSCTASTCPTGKGTHPSSLCSQTAGTVAFQRLFATLYIFNPPYAFWFLLKTIRHQSLCCPNSRASGQML